MNNSFYKKTKPVLITNNFNSTKAKMEKKGGNFCAFYLPSQNKSS